MTVLKEWLKDVLPKLFQHTGNYETIVFGVLMLLLLHRTRDGHRAGARALVAGTARRPRSRRPTRPRRRGASARRRARRCCR